MPPTLEDFLTAHIEVPELFNLFNWGGAPTQFAWHVGAESAWSHTHDRVDRVLGLMSLPHCSAFGIKGGRDDRIRGGPETLEIPYVPSNVP